MRTPRRRVALAALICAAGAAAPAQAATTTVKASADSYVAADQPSQNFGAATKLNVKASPANNAYLRFNLPSSGVLRATLRLFATHDSKKGVTVAPVSNSSWGETTITWSNAPPIASAPVVTSGGLKSGKWVALDVTSMVTSGGVRSLGIRSGGDSTSVASRESRGNEPQLVVETDSTTNG